jgi:hypothetical protein
MRDAPKRGRGRPRLDASWESVGVTLPLSAKQYDQIAEQARRDRVSIPEWIRTRFFRPKREL